MTFLRVYVGAAIATVGLIFAGASTRLAADGVPLMFNVLSAVEFVGLLVALGLIASSGRRRAEMTGERTAGGGGPGAHGGRQPEYAPEPTPTTASDPGPRPAADRRHS